MIEFDEYIAHGKPGQKDTDDSWQTVFGLTPIYRRIFEDYFGFAVNLEMWNFLKRNGYTRTTFMVFSQCTCKSII